MNIFDILQGKVVVYGDEDIGVIVAYNGSATFEMFCHRGQGLYEAIEVITRYNVKSIEQARMVAIEFVESLFALEEAA
jgi:dTDP-glucose pyrophosphorylase